MPTPFQIDVLSGLAAGLCTTIVTHPLDVIKVRLQLSPSTTTSVVPILRSFTGFSSYYRGIMPNLIGNISAWGIYFALYNKFKQTLPSHNSTVNYFSSSVLAGVSTSIITNPIWVLKTRILGNYHAYSSVLDGVKKMLANEGVSSFWKGTLPSLFQVLQASLQITIYDHIKSYLHTNEHDITTWQYLYASATSKTLSMMVWYPTQVIRARQQNSKNSISIISVIKDLARHRLFYKGLSANILRVLPATCITFVVYEQVKRLLLS